MNETETRPDPRNWRFSAAQIFMLLGLGSLVLCSASAYRGREPIATWFFNCAWWSYILFVDGWVYRRKGESLLLNFPGRFLFLALWSIVFWLLFEAANLRLHNWSYVQLPASQTARWIGYALAFATVVPGLLETADLIDSANFIHGGKVKALGWKRRVEPYLVGAGALMIALPLVWPKLFFPLIWGALVLLLEPLNERWGLPSLLSDWRVGQTRRALVLIIAGLFCGGLWEWWNFWSRAQWNYSIPWGGGFKIFEMPAAGYLGFPPFALEAAVATTFVAALWDRSPKFVRALGVLAAVGFAAAMFGAIDHATVSALQP